MKKMKMVTGKLEQGGTEDRDLTEIISGAKASKFGKYKSHDDYKNALFRMSHIEICEEVMRVGETPSSLQETCRKKCLDAYDRAQKPRKVTHAEPQQSQNLEDIIQAGVKRANKARK